MPAIQKSGTFKVVDNEGNTMELYPNILTDTSLSESSKAADGARVGEKIAEINSNLAEINSNLAEINSNLAEINSNLPLPLTQTEYDALSKAEQKNGRLYVIVEATE